MNPKFQAMMAKKKDMKPSEKNAKMNVLHGLKSALADDMSDKMDGMKKVSVMSNSPEGLNAGLDKAKMMANQDPSQDPSQMHMGGMAAYSDGGIAQNSDPNEQEHVQYSGQPHDDGFMSPNPNEAYHAGMPMSNKSSPQDPNEPEHVMYDGAHDEQMGPGYYEGGEMGPNEAMPDEVSYSGHGEDYGAEHKDSDEYNSGYADGGEVKSPLDEAADSADEEREQTEGDMGDPEEAHPEFKGLNIQQVEEKLQHLMRMKKQMEKQ